MEERRTIRFVPNEYYLEEARRRIAAIANYAMITINGEDYHYPIAASVNRDGFFKHYFDIEDEPVGDIEKLKLYDVNGAYLGETTDGIIEKDDNGWSISIKQFVTLEEGTVDV